MIKKTIITPQKNHAIQANHSQEYQKQYFIPLLTLTAGYQDYCFHLQGGSE
jgi:hypothetical protein